MTEHVTITYTDGNCDPIGTREVPVDSTIEDVVLTEYDCGINIQVSAEWSVVKEVRIDQHQADTQLHIELRFSGGNKVDPFVCELITQRLARLENAVNVALQTVKCESKVEEDRRFPEWEWLRLDEEMCIFLAVPIERTTAYRNIVQVSAKIDELLRDLEPRARVAAAGVTPIQRKTS